MKKLMFLLAIVSSLFLVGCDEGPEVTNNNPGANLVENGFHYNSEMAIPVVKFVEADTSSANVMKGSMVDDLTKMMNKQKSKKIKKDLAESITIIIQTPYGVQMDIMDSEKFMEFFDSLFEVFETDGFNIYTGEDNEGNVAYWLEWFISDGETGQSGSINVYFYTEDGKVSTVYFG